MINNVDLLRDDVKKKKYQKTKLIIQVKNTPKIVSYLLQIYCCIFGDPSRKLGESWAK